MNKLDNILENTADVALKRRAKFLINNLEIKDKDKLLDIGCGDGFYLYLTSRLNKKLKLIGTDFDKRALESAKKNLPKVKLVTGDLMKGLPFKDNFFDKIVMSEVAEHLPSDLIGLKEVFRILKPGGVLLISVPHKNYPFLWDPLNKICEIFFGYHIKSGYWAGIWNQHIRLYSERELLNLLKKTGFVVTDHEIQTYWCLPFNHHIINLGARIIAKNPKSSISKGANKFSRNKNKGLFVKVYTKLSNTIDYINDVLPNKNCGVSLVAKAIKL